MNFISDVTGDKKSSKRLAGLSSFGVGLFIALISVVADALGADVNIGLIRTVLTTVLSAGTACLGIGAFEYFSGAKDKKNNGNGVGYKKG